MEDADLKPDEEARKRLLACRADYNLLDPGSRPLFNEYLEMSKFLVHINYLGVLMRRIC